MGSADAEAKVLPAENPNLLKVPTLRPPPPPPPPTHTHTHTNCTLICPCYMIVCVCVGGGACVRVYVARVCVCVWGGGGCVRACLCVRRVCVRMSACVFPRVRASVGVCTEHIKHQKGHLPDKTHVHPRTCKASQSPEVFISTLHAYTRFPV